MTSKFKVAAKANTPTSVFKPKAHATVLRHFSVNIMTSKFEVAAKTNTRATLYYIASYKTTLNWVNFALYS